MTSWEAGAQVGPYTLIERLGAGGMGEVWKALDTRLHRTVALKRQSGPRTTRFDEEARAIAALNHPHICQLYDIGPDHLVLEYVAGRPLQGPVPTKEALPLALQLAGALEESHRRGILHRDLKPSNVMVTESGMVKLLDFGIAKLLRPAEAELGAEATQTIAGTIAGTAAYMAPEQAEGKPVDVRSEVFSFGALLYEMLSGRRAFAGESLAAVLSAVLRDQPAPLAVPEAYARVVQRCLAKNPGERFQSMTELREALQRAESEPSMVRPSIAVLPFANLSADKDNEYFSDGLSEEIINTLAQNAGLKVIARTSAFAFRGKEQDIRGIADALGVNHVVEGSVRKAGSRIRVTAQLIAAADGSHVWSQRYDRDLEDIFAVQDELASAIAGALQGKLAAAPAAARRYTPKLPAYEAYLKARYHQWRLVPEALRQAEDYYQQAIQLDPHFALAHVGYADLILLRTHLGIMPMSQGAPLSAAAAETAVRIDPNLAEAHAMLGVVAANRDYDWDKAGEHFRRALALNPGSPQVRAWYGFFYLLRIGRLAESEEALRHAIGEDPLNSSYQTALLNNLVATGRYESGALLARELLATEPGLFFAEVFLGAVAAHQGRIGDALAHGQNVLRAAPWHWGFKGFLAAMQQLSGDPSAAAELVATIPAEVYGAPLGMVGYHYYCGSAEQFAFWMEKAIEQRHPGVWVTLSMPMGRTLRSGPYWPPIAAKLKLTEAMANDWAVAGITDLGQRSRTFDLP